MALHVWGMFWKLAYSSLKLLAVAIAFYVTHDVLLHCYSGNNEVRKE